MICFLCYKVIEGNYVRNGKYFAHETCEDKGIIEHKETVSKAGSKARAHMEKLGDRNDSVSKLQSDKISKE